MADLNEYSATGRLVADPDLKYTSEGQAVARIRLAVNGVPPKGGGEPETLFIMGTAWGKLAENVSQYMKKGHRAAVSGRLRLSTWTTKEGQKRERIEIVLRNVVFLEPKGAAGSQVGSGVERVPEPEPEEVPF